MKLDSNKKNIIGFIGDSVPIIIDNVKNYEAFQMSRCSYFSIKSDTPAPGWMLNIENFRIPFLMMGLSGVIMSPSTKSPTFDSPQSFSDLFESIESHESLYIDTDDIWLPNIFFSRGNNKRGNVFRIPVALFQLAMNFRIDIISEKIFIELSSEHLDSIEFSPSETKSLSTWMKQEIDQAREEYKQNPQKRLERDLPNNTG